jgi:hypothetical protein
MAACSIQRTSSVSLQSLICPLSRHPTWCQHHPHVYPSHETLQETGEMRRCRKLEEVRKATRGIGRGNSRGIENEARRPQSWLIFTVRPPTPSCESVPKVMPANIVVMHTRRSDTTHSNPTSWVPGVLWITCPHIMHISMKHEWRVMMCRQPHII